MLIHTFYKLSICPSMFQFTFDKDGKVFDATLPMVSGFERKVSSGKYLYFVM